MKRLKLSPVELRCVLPGYLTLRISRQDKYCDPSVVMKMLKLGAKNASLGPLHCRSIGIFAT